MGLKRRRVTTGFPIAECWSITLVNDSYSFTRVYIYAIAILRLTATTTTMTTFKKARATTGIPMLTTSTLRAHFQSVGTVSLFTGTSMTTFRAHTGIPMLKSSSLRALFQSAGILRVLTDVPACNSDVSKVAVSDTVAPPRRAFYWMNVEDMIPAQPLNENGSVKVTVKPCAVRNVFPMEIYSFADFIQCAKSNRALQARICSRH